MPSTEAINTRNYKSLMNAHQFQPRSFEELVAIKGVGPKSVRAVALVSQLVYGTEISWRDPARFSFAHCGKDGTPYPVDRKAYDRSIELPRAAIEEAKIEKREKLIAATKAYELAESFGADKTVATVGAYLMDLKLGEAFVKGKLDEHVRMSLEAAKPFLKRLGLEQETKKILNCIEAHHGTVPYICREAEVCANADACRFFRS